MEPTQPMAYLDYRSPKRGTADAAFRVVVFRALQLGDLLCAIPAFRALRAAWPDAHVTLVGLSWSQDLRHRFPRYLDDVIDFPGFPGLPERPVDAARLPTFFADVRNRRFDLAIQMQGNGRIANSLVSRFGARAMAGFVPADAAGDPDVAIPGAHLLPYPERLSEVDRHLALMTHLGIPERGRQLEFPIREAERAEASSLLAREGLVPGRFACLHPGSRAAERRWPLEHFVAVGRALAGRGLRVAITGHGEDEERRAAALAAALGPCADNLAGRTSLGGVAALLEASRLLVSNDTGVSHIAAALRVPSVVVFVSTEPSRWAPSNRQLHRPVLGGTGDVERVIEEADALLSGEKAHVA